ncbi:CXXX repeat peptide maturase [Prevotella sp.]|uniref:CXXX repeat peptide maturase n=1 Tax=Prevotella sp. TaxID=59823 RepID=UPI0025F573B8|nr:CXXX repeat peptide maturase [Prevotella sp.]
MIKYIVILLDDTSTSFCHYANGKTERRLMPLQTLKDGICYAMKENLNIQFVYPEYALHEEYLKVIDSIDHTDIKPFGVSDGGCGSASYESDVVVFNTLEEAGDCQFRSDTAYVVRTDKAHLFAGCEALVTMLGKVTRLNIVITDVQTFTEGDFEACKSLLGKLSEELERLYVSGRSSQLNLLTDRMLLDQMNNCGAGETTITLAPDGRFYVCPAFYQSAGGYAVGDLEHGLDIKNQQLYRLDHAPICRICDAWQCRRCVWLNRLTTLEVNTPSHEQCVMAHLERNQAMKLLKRLKAKGFGFDQEVKEIDYLDPFTIRHEW